LRQTCPRPSSPPGWDLGGGKSGAKTMKVFFLKWVICIGAVIIFEVFKISLMFTVIEYFHYAIFALSEHVKIVFKIIHPVSYYLKYLHYNLTTLYLFTVALSKSGSHSSHLLFSLSIPIGVPLLFSLSISFAVASNSCGRSLSPTNNVRESADSTKFYSCSNVIFSLK
jgi:hypothetical protein